MKTKYFLLGTILVVAIFCFGNIANAQTTSTQASVAQLQTQIQALLQQVAALKAQQGETKTWCHTFNTKLGFVNSNTEDVVALHQVLQKENISYGADDINTYASGTEVAIISFQKKYGIKQTGYVGTLTKFKLNLLYGCGAANPPVATVNPVASNNPPATNVATTTNTTAPTGPLIKVISPNGREVLITGQKVAVKWSTQNIPNYQQIDSIKLKAINDGAEYILATGTANDGEENVIIPTKINQGLFKVVISAIVNSATISGASDDYFTVAENLVQPVLSFIASDSNGQKFDGNIVTLQEGQTMNFDYSSVDATKCYAYVDSTLMNDTDFGLTQGETSGHWETMAESAGATVNYMVVCFNTNGKQVGKSITLKTTATLAQPLITVISPKIGSVFSSQTTMIPFSWSWTGNFSSVPFCDLIDKNGAHVYGLDCPTTYASGSIVSGIILAPADLPIPVGTAQYRFKVCPSYGATEGCAFGDYFSITKNPSK